MSARKSSNTRPASMRLPRNRTGSTTRFISLLCRSASFMLPMIGVMFLGEPPLDFLSAAQGDGVLLKETVDQATHRRCIGFLLSCYVTGIAALIKVAMSLHRKRAGPGQRRRRISTECDARALPVLWRRENQAPGLAAPFADTQAAPPTLWIVVKKVRLWLGRLDSGDEAVC